MNCRAGAGQAALITYYGFLSIFPLPLGVAVLSRVLADHPDLRRRLIAEIVPPALRPTIEHSLATMPTSTVPFVVGLIGLLLSGTGVVFSAYQTLNHVAAVRYRLRLGFAARYVRMQGCSPGLQTHPPRQFTHGRVRNSWPANGRMNTVSRALSGSGKETMTHEEGECHG